LNAYKGGGGGCDGSNNNMLMTTGFAFYPAADRPTRQGRACLRPRLKPERANTAAHELACFRSPAAS